MKVRVVTDAIVGGGYFLTHGEQIELADLGEFADAMLRDGAIERAETIIANTEPKVTVNPAWLF